MPNDTASFDRAQDAWNDVADLKVSVDVWRYTNGHGDPSPNVCLVLNQGTELLAGVHVSLERRSA